MRNSLTALLATPMIGQPRLNAINHERVQRVEGRTMPPFNLETGFATEERNTSRLPGPAAAPPQFKKQQPKAMKLRRERAR